MHDLLKMVEENDITGLWKIIKKTINGKSNKKTLLMETHGLNIMKKYIIKK